MFVAELLLCIFSVGVAYWGVGELMWMLFREALTPYYDPLIWRDPIGWKIVWLWPVFFPFRIIRWFWRRVHDRRAD